MTLFNLFGIALGKIIVNSVVKSRLASFGNFSFFDRALTLRESQGIYFMDKEIYQAGYGLFSSPPQAVMMATKRLLFQNGELIAQSENLRRKQYIAVGSCIHL
jgi:hypothetical protein